MNLSKRIGINEVKALAKDVPPTELYELMRSDDDTTRRNAAWAMTHKSDSEIALLPQQELIDLVLTTESTPLRRLTLNLIARQPMEAEGVRSDFLDFCMAHMVMLEEPPGVQALCMKLAHRMCGFYPELMHEFRETLRLIHIEHYKPGMRCVIKKLRK